MKIPLFLLAVSLLVCALAFVLPVWRDVLLFGIPSALASLWLVWTSWRKRTPPPKPRRQPKRKRARHQRRSVDLSSIKGPSEAEINARDWVIVDGSNVIHWINNEPNIKPLLDVLERLKHHGYTAGVIFDASVGHMLHGTYKHDATFSELLGLPLDRIMVVPTGTVADQYILQAARDFRAKIVTNDRYRDWADDFPEVKERGLLITGRYRDGVLFTSLGPRPKRAQRRG